MEATRQALSVLAFTAEGPPKAITSEAINRSGARLLKMARIADYEFVLDHQVGAEAFLVAAEQDDDDLLDLLDRLNAESEARSRPLIAAISPALVDLVSARVNAPEAMLIVDGDASQLAFVLRSVLQPRQPTLNDVTADRSAQQLRKLSEDVDRIARTLATLSASHEVITVADEALEELSEPARVDEAGAIELIRALLRARRLRERFFAPELFSDPAWDMLLDLAAARLERKRVAVSSLCIAASVPPTTALRYIKTMTDGGLFSRQPDRSDGRRVFIELSDHALSAMLRYLGALRRSVDVVN